MLLRLLQAVCCLFAASFNSFPSLKKKKEKKGEKRRGELKIGISGKWKSMRCQTWALEAKVIKMAAFLLKGALRLPGLPGSGGAPPAPAPGRALHGGEMLPPPDAPLRLGGGALPGGCGGCLRARSRGERLRRRGFFGACETASPSWFSAWPEVVYGQPRGQPAQRQSETAHAASRPRRRRNQT